MKARYTSENRGGFTLIELLVVIAIIGLLVAITIPSINTILRKALPRFEEQALPWLVDGSACHLSQRLNGEGPAAPGKQVVERFLALLAFRSRMDNLPMFDENEAVSRRDRQDEDDAGCGRALDILPAVIGDESDELAFVKGLLHRV